MRIARITRRLPLALIALSIWGLIQPPGLFSTAAYSVKSPATQSGAKGTGGATKEQITARLTELDALIASLKTQLQSSPKNAALLAQLNAAMTEYRARSESMGGDQGLLSAESSSQREPERSLGSISVPPGCTSATTTATQSTPTAIPTGPAVVTSTIVVSGAGTFLFDVNATTFITHTFAADLDITLTSPAGTVVTLTTDNGAGNDNVFNGTVWDDDANPAGLVPYTTNNGLVTDHAYVNLTTATPLVPEEAMGAFIGENPNGTWTITISDDLAGDGGSLDSWSLELTTLTAPPQTTESPAFTQSTPTAIPTGPAVVTSTIVVSGAGTFLFDVDATTFITHTFAADLDITLTSPAGTVVTLTTDNGAGNDNVFNGTVWDDDANPAGLVPYTTNNGLVTDHAYVNLTTATPLVPEEAMGAFIGEDPNGTWTITISDDLAGDGGSLDSWSLDITTASCASPCTITCPANITQSNDANQCGAVVTYPAPTTSGSCGTITCSPASGSFFPKGTTTVTCTDGGGMRPTDIIGGSSSCSFTVTVNDTQPPTITCPVNATAVATPSCPAAAGSTFTYATPTASDNCPGVTVSCTPASGTTFPAGTTTVSCTATDTSGNTATCSFTVKLFNVAIQDRSNANAVLAWNTSTGEYVFCCNGSTFTGVGKVATKGCTYTIDHTPADRRVHGSVNMTNFTGEGYLQTPPGVARCSISDNDVRNNTYTCLGSAPPPCVTLGCK